MIKDHPNKIVALEILATLTSSHAYLSKEFLTNIAWWGFSSQDVSNPRANLWRNPSSNLTNEGVDISARPLSSSWLLSMNGRQFSRKSSQGLTWDSHPVRDKCLRVMIIEASPMVDCFDHRILPPLSLVIPHYASPPHSEQPPPPPPWYHRLLQ